MKNNLSGSYYLTGDIDCSATSTWNGGKGFAPVGTASASVFSGSFDGKGYNIINLTINRPTTSNVGLFGYVVGDKTIQNVGLINANITGAGYTGGLIGTICISKYNVKNVFVTGTVTGSGTGTGGLIGYIYDDVSVSDCYSAATVIGEHSVGGLVGGISSNYNKGQITFSYATGDVTGSGSNVGGLVGHIYTSKISDTYATGNVTGTGFGSNVGGLVGLVGVASSYSSTYQIERSYASGNVTANSYSNVGGLAGSLNGIGYEIKTRNNYATGNVSGSSKVGGLIGDLNLYATANTSYSIGSVTGSSNVGGLVGVSSGSATNSFWDKDTSGRSTSAAGTGKTTAQMKLQTTFSGWNFTSIWEKEAGCYPKLKALPAAFNLCPPIVTVSNCNELQNMKNNLAGRYVLSNDIDCSATSTWDSGKGFAPVGDTSAQFVGSFDGNGYKITGLTINRPSTSNVGLFGYTQYAAIKNVGLENVNIKGSSAVGSLVGNSFSSSIVNSYATGSVSIPGVTTNVGGLVGVNSNSSTITNSYATCSVSGSGAYIGGLVGLNNDSSSITNSYSAGSVAGNSSAGSVGGLVGGNSNSTVTNSYATGSVLGYSSVGGLVGYNNSASITNSYSTGLVTGFSANIGGLVGYNSFSTITTSYWDKETSGQSTSGGGTGKTTAEMKTQSTFSGWDFADVWCMPSNDYPRLKFEHICSLPVCTGCAVLSGSVCVAGSGCSGELSNCVLSGNNGTCECYTGGCYAGRQCVAGACTNCASSETCGACNCGSKQKPTGSGDCANNNDCCTGECGVADSPSTCSYDDDLCPDGECNRDTYACCASYAPYWRNSNCRACNTTSGLSGTCTTKGQECNSNYNCIDCAANTQCTCDAGQVANGSGACVTPACTSDAQCGIDLCINAGKHNAFCSTCSSENKVWVSVNSQCENCTAGSTYAAGVCLCSDGKTWNSGTNVCSARSLNTSNGSKELIRSNAGTSSERYENIKNKMTRIKSKLSGKFSGNVTTE